MFKVPKYLKVQPLFLFTELEAMHSKKFAIVFVKKTHLVFLIWNTLLYYYIAGHLFMFSFIKHESLGFIFAFFYHFINIPKSMYYCSISCIINEPYLLTERNHFSKLHEPYPWTHTQLNSHPHKSIG